MWKANGTCAYGAEILVNIIQKWSSLQHHLTGPHADSLAMPNDSSAYATKTLANVATEMAKVTTLSHWATC